MNGRISRIAPLAAVVLAALALLVGCGGGGGSSQSASDVAHEYVDARNSGDAAKVCDLYTDKLKQRLGASKCATYITEQTSGGTIKFSVTSVEENGDHATAKLQTAGNTELPQGTELQVNLVRQNGDWLIDGFGINGGAGAGANSGE